jgi:4-amino-4-deoxy-L-arabinose transferase-like glycosyltransferase
MRATTEALAPPPVGAAPEPASADAPPAGATHASPLQRVDLRNVAFLLLGFAVVLLLVSPARAYPINDDWVYARGVEGLLRWDYQLPGAQATSLASIAWGALFAWLFGFSFTVLSAATLVMSAACIVLFYLLLRHLAVTPAYALFGAALLGLNPIYVNLSYSFMTDVTFLAFLLAGCLCFVRAMQGYGTAWLWWAGMAAALAYLTRQFGILLVPVALGYMLWSRKWSWHGALAVSVIPAATAIVYMLWERTQPVPLAALELQRIESVALANPIQYLTDRIQRIDWVLSMPGLLLAPLLWRPRRLVVAAPVFIILFALQLRSAQLYGTLFPSFGNVIDHTGFVMGYYDAAPIWVQPVWAILGLAGSLAVSLYVGICAEQAWAWLRAKPWRARTEDASLFVYALGALLAGVVFLVPLFLFDRYLLPIMLVLMVMALRRMSARGPAKPPLRRLLLLVPIALFALLAQRDYNAHAAARWQAAEQLVAQGTPREHIDAGFEWAGRFMNEEGALKIKQTKDYTYLYFPAYAAIDPVYVVSDLPREGYNPAGAVPYSSWLTGGETRRVLVLKRK